MVEHGEALAEQFALSLPLVLEAQRVWGRLEDELGTALEVMQHGGMMIAETTEELEVLERKHALERRLGLDTELIGGAEARAIAPYLSESVVAAGWCPSEGHANPRLVGPAFARAAARHAASVRPRSGVTGLARRSGGLGARARGRRAPASRERPRGGGHLVGRGARARRHPHAGPPDRAQHAGDGGGPADARPSRPARRPPHLDEADRRRKRADRRRLGRQARRAGREARPRRPPRAPLRVARRQRPRRRRHRTRPARPGRHPGLVRDDRDHARPGAAPRRRAAAARPLRRHRRRRLHARPGVRTAPRRAAARPRDRSLARGLPPRSGSPTSTCCDRCAAPRSGARPAARADRRRQADRRLPGRDHRDGAARRRAAAPSAGRAGATRGGRSATWASASTAW